MLNLNQNSVKTWYFPPLLGGLSVGMSHAGMDLFKSEDNLGRESAQNSLNATNNNEPVLVKYELEEIESEFFPGKEDYLARLDSAKEFFEKIGNKTGGEVERISSAIDLMKNKTIPTLIIRDYGTTGLDGDENQIDGRYFRFIKSTGISVEQGSTAGTYGHGQNALYNFSELKSISVFSKYQNNKNQINSLFIGRSSLPIHTDPVNKWKTQNTGYFGYNLDNHSSEIGEDQEYWRAFRNDETKELKIPLNRLELGTDIYIWGFDDDQSEWSIKLAMGISFAFFQAIKENKIKFEITQNGKSLYQINKENFLDELNNIEKDCNQKLSGDEWRKHPISRVKGYLNCEGETIKNNVIFKKTYQKYVTGLGRIQISIYSDKNDPSLKNRYVLMRKPLMTIKETGYKNTGTPYTAICKVLDDSGNRVIAELEDPSHTDLKGKYVKNKKKKRHHTKLLTELQKTIQKAIDNLDPPIEFTKDIPGINKFISGNPLGKSKEVFFDGNSQNDNNDSDNNNETFEERIKNDVETVRPKTSQSNKKSLTLRSRPSSKGNSGGNRGNLGGKGKSNKGQGHGAGNKTGNAKLDKDGKKESIIPSESVYISRARNNNNEKNTLIRVSALTQVKGDLRLGFALNERGNKFFPIKKYSLINCSLQNYECKNLIFKDIDLKQNDYFEIEVEFPTTANIAIGAY